MLRYITQIFLSFFICLTLASSAQAGFLSPTKQTEFNNNINNIGSTYDQNVTINDTIANIIQVILGILGIIFMILILIAGGNWMLANGNEEKVKKAKTTIRYLFIGLVLVLGAFAITYTLSSVFSNTLLKQ